LVRGTPTTLTGTLGDVQVNYVADSVSLTGYLDSTGLVSPAPVPIPTTRIQYDVLNNAGNGSIFEFRVDYEAGVTVIGASDPEGFFDGAGNRQTFWAGLAVAELFDAGFGTYNYDGPNGSEWEIEYQSDHVTWRQLGNGFFPDTATGATEFGFNPTFALYFPPDTALDLQPASVAGRSAAGGPVSSNGRVLSAIADPGIEIDSFPDSRALVGIQLPDGAVENLLLSGPTTVEVHLGNLADTDGDAREQVPTEMVQLELTGLNPTLGLVSLRLRDPSLPPFRRSTGQIEENVNNTPGILDVPPFAPGGTADSFFDVFFEVEVGGQILHSEHPSRMESTISHKPPSQGTAYDKPPGMIPLLDEQGNPTGISIVQASHVPSPGDIEVDIFPDSFAVVDLVTPAGTETLTLSGPTTVEVEIESVADSDGDGREQVPTEIVQMDLTGDSSFGPVTLRLREASQSPFARSTGEIEETTNTQVGRLDLPPFASEGTADSFFDVFFEIEVMGATFHNVTPKRLRRVIDYKPPKWGQMYESPETIPLFDEKGNPTGVSIGANRHAPDPKEIDFFPDTLADIEIIFPDGQSETVRLRGPTTVEVDLAAIGDPDVDTREQVPTEMVQLELRGESSLGPVTLRLRDPSISPFMRSIGEIEEQANLTPSILDIRPFTEAGTADSFFDVFFEIEVGEATYHNEDAKRFSATITHKPPRGGDVYESPVPTGLFDENNEPAGVTIGASKHVPVPDRDGDGVLDDEDNCPDWPNPDQDDADRNGIGDECECGDQNGDGTVDVNDILAINAAIFDPSQVTDLCDTNDDQLCNVQDILGANAKIFGAKAYCSRYPTPLP
jgi:hypothetical protein